MEYLVHLTQHIPPDIDPQLLADVKAAEYARGTELVEAGIMKRIWRDPGKRAVYALYEVDGPDQLHDTISSLPLYPWFEVEVIPLGLHKLDPTHD